MKKVIAVCGPTAVGKTRMGVSLAEALHGEVISGDSMQIYRTMDIGTAKITEEDIISGSLANTNSYLKKIASKLTDYDGEDKDPFHELDFDKTKSV
mgnify:CR=1 FL=1